MLVIRLQRTGRKKLANFRIVVQDSRRTPSSGKVVAYLGNYDPHTKSFKIDKEKAGFFLKNGAQPSEKVIILLKKEKVTLPEWVKDSMKKNKKVKNPEKWRSTAPATKVQEESPVANEQPSEQEPVLVQEAPVEEAQKENEA